MPFSKMGPHGPAGPAARADLHDRKVETARQTVRDSAVRTTGDPVRIMVGICRVPLNAEAITDPLTPGAAT